MPGVCVGKGGQEGNVQHRAGPGGCDGLIPRLKRLLYWTGGKEGGGLGGGVGSLGRAPLLCSGSLFGELADDTNEGSVLVLQPLVVRLQLCQNLQRDKDKAG